jgi:UDP-N-acetylglucosamine--N-acetylmuramyl-(pentapeptide) pyrophosphoryl-undecaprenol N-acetylglucosamine transferase
MKIVFTGGGTGGHFYPIIAVAEGIQEEARERKILNPQLFYMAPTKYNPRALFDNDIEFVSVPAGKVRRYFSLLNITDVFKTAYGVVSAYFSMFRIYPDVVFGKGGYASFPGLLAARIFHIPIVIHESDSKPGRVNAWAAKFARRVAVSYPSAAVYFEKELGEKAKISDKKDPNFGKSKIAYTGNPVRREVAQPLSNGAKDFLHLEESLPTILVLGGSQGSQFINDVMVDAVPELVKRYQIIHQTGRKNFADVNTVLTSIMKDNPEASRYKPMDYLNDLTMRMAAGAADIVVSRAGSSIFEIAAWGKPSIIVPLNTAVSHDQTENAFSYARSGACTVMEEHNMTSHILISEIDRIMGNPALREKMKKSALGFAQPDAARKIAQVILEIGLEHE